MGIDFIACFVRRRLFNFLDVFSFFYIHFCSFSCLWNISLFFFFFQAKAGIRDAHYGLEFRRVLFRSSADPPPAIVVIAGDRTEEEQAAADTLASAGQLLTSRDDVVPALEVWRVDPATATTATTATPSTEATTTSEAPNEATTTTEATTTPATTTTTNVPQTPTTPPRHSDDLPPP